MTITLLALLSSRPAQAQVSGQSFQVIPEGARASVGDSVTLRFRVRLDERDLLFDTIPQPVGTLPVGVRVLSVERLTRTPDRLFHGRARLAFYRPGRRPTPTFGLSFMRAVKGVQRATLLSDSAFVDIIPLLPAGNPPLKDIKDLEHTPASPLLGLLLASALALAGGLLFRRRRRRSPAIVRQAEPSPEPMERSPYQVALDRLVQIEGEHWPARREVAAHYEAIVEVLREYLEDAEQIAALERTTTELLWALPPHLSEAGLADRCHDLLSEADLVKFARLVPAEATAVRFLARARELVGAWHEASQRETADALR